MLKYPALAKLFKKRLLPGYYALTDPAELLKMQEYTHCCIKLAQNRLCGSTGDAAEKVYSCKQCGNECNGAHACIFAHGNDMSEWFRLANSVQKPVRKSAQEMYRIASRSNIEIVADTVQRQFANLVAAVNRAEKNMDPCPVLDGVSGNDGPAQLRTHEDALEMAERDKSMTFAGLVWYLGLTRESIKKDGPVGNIRTGWFKPHLLARYNITGAELAVIPGVDASWLTTIGATCEDLRLLGLYVRVMTNFFGLSLHDIRELKVTPKEWIELGLNKDTLVELGALQKEHTYFFATMVSSERHYAYRWRASHFFEMGFTVEDLKQLGYTIIPLKE